MIDQLRAIAIFYQVVDAGSFRAAAKHLRLSPSVVSHHISQLEQHLGTALLYRSTRKISLTDEGARLFASSKKMIEAAQEGLDAIQNRTAQISGRLNVAVSGNMFENPIYLRHLMDFAKQYPLMDFSVSFSDTRIELIGSDFDAAIRTGWMENSQYKSRKLFSQKRAIVASPAYLAGRATPREVVDLGQLDWIKMRQFSPSRQLINQQGIVPQINPNVAIEVDSVMAMCQMAVAGMGIACVPRYQVEQELGSGLLVELELNWELHSIDVHVVWPNNVSLESLSYRFVQFMVARLATQT